MAKSRSRGPKTRRVNRARPRGVLNMTSAGYAFVQTAEGEFFIPASKVHDAFDGDVVEVSRLSSSERGSYAQAGPDRPAARVVRVVLRAHESIVGRYEVAEPFGIVVPEDPRIKHDIFTLRADAPHVQHGDIVRVRMTVYPNRREPAQGVVEEVLGHVGDAGMDVELIVARHKLETKFSPKVLEDVAHAAVGEAEALSSGDYRDIRNRVVFTIDPADAKDFDDALSFDEVGGYLRLGVHIADVSHYVPWNSPTDLEARRRSTSVYLVDRVVPMLPEVLSNDVCSLRPREPRRAMTVDLYLTETFSVHHVDAYPSIIESCARLDYDTVQECFDRVAGGERPAAVSMLQDVCKDPESVLVRLLELKRVSVGLHERRLKRGGLDFDGVEAKVRLDDEGRPVGVDIRKTTQATSLVEEAMIAANEAVARLLRDGAIPSIYRVHEPPATGDLSALIPILQEFGYDRDVSMSRFAAGDPFAIQKVIAKAKGRLEEPLVSTLVVRAMTQARYVDACEPHFGLGSEAYTHFTSPIRRYPDLVVHRMLKVKLFGRTETTSAEEAALATIAAHASEMERKAETAARESQELKLFELLEEHIGEEFDGLVSGVTASGFFVRLDDTSEGFVSLRRAQEYFILDPERYTLTGSDSGVVYRLGARVRIRVRDVYPFERKADFDLVARLSSATLPKYKG